MSSSYSQSKARWALVKASLRAQLRSPSAIIFSVVFPFIFIIVFGFLGGGGPSLRVAFAPGTDTLNPVYKALKSMPNVAVDSSSITAQEKALSRGNLVAFISIGKNEAGYTVALRSSNASADKYGLLRSVVELVVRRVNEAVAGGGKPVQPVITESIEQGRKYRTIDFILPGMLGFSLLSTGVFGIAFMFFNLRQTLVMKRFFATPVNRLNIVLGEVIARTIFQLIIISFILTVGVSFFHYTLVNGLATFLQILVVAFVGLMLFMGFGFIVSGRAKSDSSIPPFANLIVMPQFLLGGTFFSIDAFPTWLQYIARAVPLTHFNRAMRSIAFEGANLWDIRLELGILLIWMVVVYAIVRKVFRWE